MPRDYVASFTEADPIDEDTPDVLAIRRRNAESTQRILERARRLSERIESNRRIIRGESAEAAVQQASASAGSEAEAPRSGRF